MWRAVLFDFDYTLADSSRGVLECVRFALRSQGLPPPADDAVLRTIGMSLPDTFAALAPGHPSDDLSAAFVSRAEGCMAAMTRFYEAVPVMLTELRTSGLATGIVSTKFRRRILETIAYHSLPLAFDVVIGGEDVSRAKPDPEGVELAITRLSCMKKDVLFVGDTTIDARTAQAAGVQFAGVCTGMTNADELARHGAIFVMESLSELTGAMGLRKASA